MESNTFDQTQESAPGHYKPSQTALLLLDYKGLVIDKIGPKAVATVEVAAAVRKWAKAKGIHVIHGLVDFHGTPPLPASKEAGRLSQLMKQVQANGGDQEPPELLEGGGDQTFNRRPGFISALQSEGILEYLKDHGVRSLILMGLSTGGCVLRTSFDAAEKDFVATVISDGCADAKQALHDFAFASLFNRTSFVATAKEFRDGYDAIY